MPCSEFEDHNCASCNNMTIQIEMDEEVFLGMNKHPHEMAREMRLAAAVKWYELHMISQGMAARLAGLSRAMFLNLTRQPADIKLQILKLLKKTVFRRTNT
jgi:predicted HTH domain antitoxin